jgi:hypothetical protein
MKNIILAFSILSFTGITVAQDIECGFDKLYRYHVDSTPPVCGMNGSLTMDCKNSDKIILIQTKVAVFKAGAVAAWVENT